MRATRPPAASAPLRFALEVRPASKAEPWHAVLVVRGSGARTEFDSPLQLLRHLAQLTLPHTPGGLR